MSELYSYPANDYRSYLAHHGVKGMKWGVRHEQERKSRIMKKYGITSKQYDSVINKTKEKHLKKYGRDYKEYKKKTRINGAIAGLATTASQTATWKILGANKEQTAKIAAAGVLGTAAGMAINELLETPEYYESVVNGRGLIDSISENREFKRMSKK